MSVVGSENDATLPLGDAPYSTNRSLVRVAAERTDFLHSTTVALSSPNPGRVIRYTLDGSMPGMSSPWYRDPITIDATCRLRARAFAPGMDDAYTADIAFTKLTYRNAVPSRAALPGLACTAYAGTWKKLPDPASLSGGTKRIVTTVCIPEGTPAENYALFLGGFLSVPQDGLYTLHLWSDDGSALLLGGEPFIDNDGLHGRAEVAREAALRGGLHAIEVRQFQGPGDAALELWIEGPGLPLQQVPPGMLVHEAGLEGSR
jgi:hexosaminidase